MKRSSWIVLIVSGIMALGLLMLFFLSQGAPEQLTQEDAIQITRKMQTAFEHKNVNGIMDYIAPQNGGRIANISVDKLRFMLVRYFRSSDKLSADLKNYAFAGTNGEASLQFDLIMHNDGPDSRKEDYAGHITLHLRRVDSPHLLGLYQTKEWRITSAETTGPELSTFGDE